MENREAKVPAREPTVGITAALNPPVSTVDRSEKIEVEKENICRRQRPRDRAHGDTKHGEVGAWSSFVSRVDGQSRAFLV